MRKNWFLASGLLATATISGQISKEYFELCRKADSLYRAGDYKNSANTYSSAFKANGWKGTYMTDTMLPVPQRWQKFRTALFFIFKERF
jgi:hypothetical protein